MPLSSGARIGIYEVIAQLGAGGMGEVYRARDSRLDRDVALKVLPPLFTSDPERLARFEREAKVLASLNHPNIAQVYGFEANAIAMELVEGPTLEDVIRGVPGSSGSPGANVRGLPLSDALPILRQIAAGLEFAHDQGIVHRDLKPANVKVKEDGTVKVLDFGLAKALGTDADGSASSVSNSPTLTARSTQLGMILGTAAYMAPEQAKGRAVDRRADVWAFGAVFFEMITGRRLFEGDDVSDVLASVLKSEPDWNALPADLPAPVRRLLRRCLEKDPKKRLRDIGDAMLQLDEALAGGSVTDSGAGAVAVAPGASAPLWRRAIPIAAAIIITAAAVVGVQRYTAPAPVAPSLVQFEYMIPAPQRFSSSPLTSDLAISPDGQAVAYAVTDPTRPAPGLAIRRFDQPEGAYLRGAEAAVAPFFSADGTSVGFVDSATFSNIKKVSVLGGPSEPVTAAGGTVLGAVWLNDGTIVFGVRGAGLFRVPQAGGKPAPLTTPPAGDEHLWPSAVPDTSLVLFVSNPKGTAPFRSGQLAAVNMTTGQVVRLKLPGVFPRYVPPGRILYATGDGSLRSVAFDVRNVAITGEPVPVMENVNVKNSGATNFAISDNGHLAFFGGGASARTLRTLAWVDRTGQETPVAAPPRAYFYARVDPTGQRLALDVRDEEQDIWVWDLKREALSRLTDRPGQEQYGLWTADGRVVFSSTAPGRAELNVHRPDGVGEMQLITDAASAKLTPFPNAITRDGKQLIFRAGGADGKNDLYVTTIGGDKSFKKLLSTEHDEFNAALSPDDKFMVFTSDLSGRPEIYVRPFPNVDGGQWPVSTAGGTEPVWSPTGREIFYLSPEVKIMVVSVDTTKGVTLGKPQVLFDASKYFFGGVGRNYDVTADGKRFIMVRESADGSESRMIPLTVILNWVERLKK